jgi:hypothetical protein
MSPSRTAAALLRASLTVLSALVVPGPAPANRQLGTVHFQVSCSPAGRQQFERGLAMLHSFFFPETLKAAVTQADPTCAVGHVLS